MPATQNARQTLETIIKNHVDIDIEQRIDNNCRFDSTSTNEITAVGSTNALITNVSQTTDMLAYCETNNYMASLANVEFSTELKNELEATLKQEGFNVATDQNVDQNIKNSILGLIESDTLQETLNNCSGDLELSNRINLDNSTNGIATNVHQSHDGMINCLFNTQTRGQTDASVQNTVDNSASADLTQVGLFASGASFLISIAIVGMVVLLMLGGGKKKSNKNSQ